jgi:hypothetical protein
MEFGVRTMRIGAIVLFSVGLGLPAVAHAATYWVSPAGQAVWPACQGDSPLDETAACSLQAANLNAMAGDTIYLRGGTYRQTSSSGCGNNHACGIEPKNSGTATARITYSAYENETPVLTSDPGLTMGRGISIHQGNGTGTYIRVTGITFRNLYTWASLWNYASYNEIDHNTFYSETGDDFGGAAGLSISSYCYGGPSYRCFSKHNWIHHNTFSKVHQTGTEACHEGADMIRIGAAYSSSNDNNSTTEQNDYNTVEYNTIAYAGHALMDTYGGYNVIRGNVMHNEGWIPDYSGNGCAYPAMPNGKYGHRGLQTTEDFGRTHQYILVEGNRFGFSSANPNNPGDANYAIASPSTIVRYNYSFGAHQSGIGTKWYSAYPSQAIALTHRGQGGTGPYNIRIYNNTTFWNGHTYPYMQASRTGCSTCPGKLAGINVYSGALDVVVKNNIAFGNYSYTLYGHDITVDSGKDPAGYPNSVIEVSNWKSQSGDPAFVNPDVSDPTSATLPNLALQASSRAVDGGTSLTQAKGAGSGTTLVVRDAMYFQDGSWGSALARDVTFFPDWIAIGTVRNVVRVKSLDYATNTIILATPMSWADNAAIWLYKKSDGAIVLAGAGPDLGASELEDKIPPTNLRIVP